MDTILFLGFAAAYLALLVWGVRLAMRNGWWTPANLPLLVVAALVYDNLVLGLGSTIGHGPALEGLNHGRFWIHAAITPTLVAWALHTLRRAAFRQRITTLPAPRMDQACQALAKAVGYV